MSGPRSPPLMPSCPRSSISWDSSKVLVRSSVCELLRDDY
jgi:hypothetical protein